MSSGRPDIPTAAGRSAAGGAKAVRIGAALAVFAAAAPASAEAKAGAGLPPAPVATAASAPPAGASRPNLLFIVVDCLRADRTLDYPRPIVPSIRALAREGTTFTQAISQASWTRPSVATLLTGLYPIEHGLGTFVEGSGGDVQAQALSPRVTMVSEVLRAAGYRTALIAEQFQFARQFGFDQGFDLYNYRAGRAANLNRHLRDWLDSLPSGPFFAYLHYLDIHWPFCPPPAVKGMLDTAPTKIDFCADWRRLDREMHEGRVPMDANDRQATVNRYDEELFDLDQRLGELFDALRARGQWDSTLIVLTADHGEEFFEHGDHGHGQSLHDELLRVPIVVKPPASWAAPRGVRVAALVESRDIPATLIAAAGARLEPGPSARSLLPLVLGGAGPAAGAASPAAAAAGGPELHAQVFSEASAMVAVRTTRWKLIEHVKEGRAELYDLVADPGETKDLAAQEPAVVAELKQAIAGWRKSVRPIAPAEVQAVDEETAEGLKALGYIQ